MKTKEELIPVPLDNGKWALEYRNDGQKLSTMLFLGFFNEYPSKNDAIDHIKESLSDHFYVTNEATK